MKKLALGLWEKYKTWPWWGKVLGCVLLVLILALLILSLVPASSSKKPLNEIDEFHDDKHTQDMKEAQAEAKVLRKEIIKNKLEIARKLNVAKTIDADTLKKREKLNDAQTMEELDALQREWGL
jgi:uncharacterized membrane protein